MKLFGDERERNRQTVLSERPKTRSNPMTAGFFNISYSKTRLKSRTQRRGVSSAATTGNCLIIRSLKTPLASQSRKSSLTSANGSRKLGLNMSGNFESRGFLNHTATSPLSATIPQPQKESILSGAVRSTGGRESEVISKTPTKFFNLDKKKL